MNRIPGQNEWGSSHPDLDTSSARKNFYGISHEQAVALFKTNSMAYQEDIMFMPYECYSYYVNAYAEYLLSDAAKSDADGASAFLAIMEYRSEENIKLPKEVKIKINAVLTRLSNDQLFFDADESIYGNFSERVKIITSDYRGIKGRLLMPL